VTSAVVALGPMAGPVLVTPFVAPAIVALPCEDELRVPALEVLWFSASGLAVGADSEQAALMHVSNTHVSRRPVAEWANVIPWKHLGISHKVHTREQRRRGIRVVASFPEQSSA